MIEKIKSPLDLKVGNYKGTEFDIIPADTFAMVCRKINELCDVVNEQQKQIDKMSCAILDLATQNGENKALESIKAEPKTPTDPYAEQRKWIGKLCRFWDDDPNDYYFDTLNRITLDGCYVKENGYIYENCEPVKPDSDIIYKGEQ